MNAADRQALVANHSNPGPSSQFLPPENDKRTLGTLFALRYIPLPKDLMNILAAIRREERPEGPPFFSRPELG
jgi:hypothetical protein